MVIGSVKGLRLGREGNGEIDDMPKSCLQGCRIPVTVSSRWQASNIDLEHECYHSELPIADTMPMRADVRHRVWPTKVGRKLSNLELYARACDRAAIMVPNCKADASQPIWSGGQRMTCMSCERPHHAGPYDAEAGCHSQRSSSGCEEAGYTRTSDRCVHIGLVPLSPDVSSDMKGGRQSPQQLFVCSTYKRSVKRRPATSCCVPRTQPHQLATALNR